MLIIIYYVNNSDIRVYVVQPITGLKVTYIIEGNAYVTVTMTLVQLKKILLVEYNKVFYCGLFFL